MLSSETQKLNTEKHNLPRSPKNLHSRVPVGLSFSEGRVEMEAGHLLHRLGSLFHVSQQVRPHLQRPEDILSHFSQRLRKAAQGRDKLLHLIGLLNG